MWIAKAVYVKVLNEIDYLRERITDGDVALGVCNTQIEALRHDNNALRERLIAAEGRMRAALAMNDLLTVQINQAQDERAQFLQKLSDPDYKIVVQVPKISRDPVVTAPGVDFEDMGDARAAQEGYAPLLPVEDLASGEDAITHLTGRVYDPASELGAEQPRLGDRPQEPSEM